MRDPHYANQSWDTLLWVVASPQVAPVMKREVVDELLIRLNGDKQAILDVLTERLAILAPLGTLDSWVPRRLRDGSERQPTTSDERLRRPKEGTSIRMLADDGKIVSHVVIHSYLWGPPHRHDWVVAVCEGNTDPRHRTLLMDDDGWYVTYDP